MCSEIKTVLQKLMTVAQCNVADQQTIPEADINNCLLAITSTTPIDDFYTYLHSLSVSPDCYCLLNEMLMSVVEPKWMFAEISCFLGNENSDKLATLYVDKLPALEVDKLATLDMDKLSTLDADKLVAVDADKLATLDVHKLATLEVDKLATLDVNKLATLEVDKLATLEVDKLATLEVDKLAALDMDKLAALDMDKLAVLDALVDHRVSLFMDIVDRLCLDAAVREFSEKKEEVFTEKDFDGIAARAASCLKALILLLKKLDIVSKSTESYSHILSQLVYAVSYKALFVCLEHMSSHDWTSEASISEAHNLLQVICSVNHCSTFEKYLCSSNGEKFAKILSDLHSKLLPSKWKVNPSAPHVFAFSVLHVKTPFLSDHLGTILSTPLILVDDHEVDNKCLGLDLIQHVVANVSKAELRWYGRADVLYDLLRKQLHSGEPEVLERTIPCLFAVLDVVEKSPLVPDGVRKEVKHDETFRVYVQNMLLETTVAIRHIYSRHLSTFIGKLGITIVRHMEQVINVVVCYLEVYDGPDEACRIDTLEALETLLCQAWPRMSNHSQVVVQSLIRLIYDVSTERTLTPVDVNRRVFDRAVKCLRLLKEICPDTINELLVALQTLNMNEAVDGCITQVLKFQTSGKLNVDSERQVNLKLLCQ